MCVSTCTGACSTAVGSALHLHCRHALGAGMDSLWGYATAHRNSPVQRSMSQQRIRVEEGSSALAVRVHWLTTWVTPRHTHLLEHLSSKVQVGLRKTGQDTTPHSTPTETQERNASALDAVAVNWCRASADQADRERSVQHGHHAGAWAASCPARWQLAHGRWCIIHCRTAVQTPTIIAIGHLLSEQRHRCKQSKVGVRCKQTWR